MKKLLVGILTLGLFILMATVVTAKSDNAAYRGSAYDPKYQDELGLIEYLSNKSGYHFWFTVSEDLGPYLAGHSYHNVYKVNLEDTTGWCGPLTVGGNPERAPYDQVGHTGETAYYRIFDTTMNAQICP